MVPDERQSSSTTNWKIQKVGDIARPERNSFVIGPFGSDLVQSDYRKSGTPVVFVRDIKRSKFHWVSRVFVSQEKAEKLKAHSAKPGDIIITKMGLPPGIAAVYPEHFPDGVITADIIRLRPDLKSVDSSFLCVLLNSYSARKQVYERTAGQTRPKLTLADYKTIQLELPSLPEQKKIAQILSTWDQAITANERLLENSQQQKKALIQQLLTGKKRLPGFDGTWEEVTLGSLFHRVTTRNEGQSTNVVTISGQQGLIRQQEFFKKSVASETLDNYFLLKRGQFAYNKSYSNGYPMGAIKRLNRYEDGVVTTLYICFELADERATDSDFYEQYFESGQLNKGLMQIAHEGGRAHGLLNVKPSDFFSLKVLKPPRNEQKAIANLLVTADRELQAQKNKLERLRTEKKALMQQLLTGRRRVKLETEAA